MSKKSRKKRRSQNRNMLILALIMAACLLLVVIAGIIISRNQDKEEATTVDPFYSGAIDVINGSTMAPATKPITENESKDEPSGETSIDPGAESTEPMESESTLEPSGSKSQESEPIGPVTESDTEPPVPSSTVPETVRPVPPSTAPSTEVETIPPTLPIPSISFPYTIEGSDVVVEKLTTYNGYYIEDGQDEPVTDVAAIVLTNKGSDLAFVGVGIAQAAGSLSFTGSRIPAGASVVILEQNKKTYDGGECYTCTATLNRQDHDLQEERIKIEQEENGTFTVTNISEEVFPVVRVQFKSYLPSENVYVGGITYTITLTEFEPNAEVNVNSSHYDPRYTKFITVSIENSK